MQKKALARTFLYIIIVGIIFLIIMLSFYSRVGEVIQSESTKNICKTDVYSKHYLKLKPFKLLNRNNGEMSSDVDCPTVDLNIDADLDTKKGQIKAKNQISIAMFDCLDQFGQIPIEGEQKLELFETKKGIDNYCVICHSIEFKDKDKEIPNLIEYWKTTDVPEKDYTFMQAFTGYQTIPNIDGFKQDVEIFVTQNNVKEIDTNEKYAVTFMYYKEGYYTKIQNALNLGISGTAGGAIGAGAAVLIGLATPGVNVAVGTMILSGAVIGGTGNAVIGYILGSDVTADWKSSVLLLPYEATKLEELKCSYLPGKQNN
jgi:hypothetical protein